MTPPIGIRGTDISHIYPDFLPCPTPQAWIDEAAKEENLSILLADHANLEHNAAQTALTTMRRYRHGMPGIANTGGAHTSDSEGKAAASTLDPMPRNVEHDGMLHMLSRLAREELRHFEQVIGIMKKRGIRYPQLSASRYAGELRKVVRKNEPGRLIDTLIVGAIIEARSCERFAALVPVLDDDLAGFYASLLKSESRHFMSYLKLANKFSCETEVQERLSVFLEQEQLVIESEDGEFRFHSGVPVNKILS
jgi:tRNA-(ms[2]io[6]A)-hydroxylase